jgi:hypothetical protein
MAAMNRSPVSESSRVREMLTKEIRRAGVVRGTGPYGVALDATLTYANHVGEAVKATGPNIVTGTGRQRATNVSGTAHRQRQHPPKPGHRNFAMNMYRVYAETLEP